MTIKSTTINYSSRTSHTRIVLLSAIASRIGLLVLMVIWRTILSPYDTSASIDPSCLSSTTTTHRHEQLVLFPCIAAAIENGIVWDSVYFVRIAQCGYEYEQTFAFLPLLPFCISLLSRTVLLPLTPLVGHRAVLALSGYLLSNISFVFAALFLYRSLFQPYIKQTFTFFTVISLIYGSRIFATHIKGLKVVIGFITITLPDCFLVFCHERLSLVILKDSEASLRASILFCFNPASIFYSSIYSESLYALLSIGGLYFLMSGANLLAVLWLALSGCARSNGVLNAGYIGFQTIHRAYDAVFFQKNAYLAIKVLISGILQCIFVFVPFVGFQAYGYYTFCDGSRSNLDILRPWCKARIPLLYNFIQSHYWGVGFLKYFQLKQLPNFLLASPILSIAVCSIIHYVKLQPSVFFSLGFQVSPKSYEVTKKNTCTSAVIQEDQTLKRRKHSNKEQDPTMHSTNDDVSSMEKTGKVPIIIIPFVLHLVFMVATAFFVMHVQVATRFLSASPPIYWFGSYVLASRKAWGYLIWGYCAAYILIGSLLFSNFYPFT